MSATRILLADDHPLLRRGLREVLDRQPDLTVVAESNNGADAVERALGGDIELAILDIAMPRLTGLQAAEQIHRRSPEVRVLILSMYDNEQYLLASLRAGACGYLLKSVADEEIVDACHAIVRGEQFLHSDETETHIGAYLARAQRGDQITEELLTPRELEVLKLVAEGYSSKRIADMLVISIKTVDSHRSNILEKLGLGDRVELTRYAIRRGLIQP